MSNEHVPASATALPSRRAALAGLAVATFAEPALAAEPSPLSALIDAHRAAWAAFEASVEALDAAEAAYESARPESFFVPCLLGGGYDSQLSADDMKKNIAEAFERQRRTCATLARIAPDEAEGLLVILDAKEMENMALVDMAFAEEKRRRDDCGLSAAEYEHGRANQAEEAAAFALCACPCRTIEDARTKAEYLANTSPFKDGVLSERQAAALIRSFLPVEG